jgi:N-acetylneuraminate lyase
MNEAECVELARHAQSAGADAFSTVAAGFFNPHDVAAAVDAAARVAAQAPKIPFFYYHLPGLSGLRVSMRKFLSLAVERIPNFGGLKFTHEDLGEFADCVREFGDRVKIYFGRDELLLPSLALGAHGAVGSTYNFAAPHYLRIAEAFRSGDAKRALELQWQARRLIDLALPGGLVSGLKRLMRVVDLDCGPARHPLNQLGESDFDDLLEKILGANLEGLFAKISDRLKVF